MMTSSIGGKTVSGSVHRRSYQWMTNMSAHSTLSTFWANVRRSVNIVSMNSMTALGDLFQMMNSLRRSVSASIAKKGI